MKLNTQVFDPKILSQNLSKARDACGKSLKEVSDLVGIPSSRLSNYEKGKYVPPLPELESISYIYRIPIFALIGKSELRTFIHSPNTSQFQNLVKIRRELISTRLHLAIEEMEMSYKDLSNKTGITYGSIKRYEDGESEPSIEELIQLAEALNIDFSDFEDRDSPIGTWQQFQTNIKEMKLVPDDLINFFINPDNIAKLVLARKISDIGIESLVELNTAISDLLENIDSD